jgi:hypothetical protein
MDTALERLQFADASLRNHVGDQCSESVQLTLQHIGLRPGARLNYQPSPVIYQQSEEGIKQPQHLDSSDESYDLSFRLLRDSFRCWQ